MDLLLNNGHIAIVDEDIPMGILSNSWKYCGGYVYRDIRVGSRWRRLYLHREIMKAPKGLVVDHINGNGLDNRKVNLRICTQGQNARNRRKRSDVSGSIYKGVREKCGNFECSVARKYVGTYATEVEAAHAYNIGAISQYGEFARLNVLPESYDEGTSPSPIPQTSKYRGVAFHKRIKLWQACLNYDKKRYYLGYFEKQSDAAKAYNEKATELLGDRAKLNVIADEKEAQQ